MANPLPDLSTADFGGSCVFHQVIDGNATEALDPREQVLHADVDVPTKSLLGDVSGGNGEQVFGFDGEAVAFRSDLVWGGHVFVEDVLGDRDQAGVGDPGAVVSGIYFAEFVLTN